MDPTAAQIKGFVFVDIDALADDGLTASINWYHMATGRGTAEEREQTYRDLADYCRLDTLAMVEIYNHLKTL